MRNGISSCVQKDTAYIETSHPSTYLDGCFKIPVAGSRAYTIVFTFNSMVFHCKALKLLFFLPWLWLRFFFFFFLHERVWMPDQTKCNCLISAFKRGLLQLTVIGLAKWFVLFQTMMNKIFFFCGWKWLLSVKCICQYNRENLTILSSQISLVMVCRSKEK